MNLKCGVILTGTHGVYCFSHVSASDKDAGREMTWFSDESRHPSSVQLQ